MLQPLYLDTARLGLMTPRARRASVDFARFSSELGCSLYLTDLLESGFAEWPSQLRKQYPGLEDWEGVSSLKQRIRRVTHANSNVGVFCSSRSTWLMQFAADLLARHCTNVLLTDLSWPPYERLVRRACRRRGVSVTKVEVRKMVYSSQTDKDELSKLLADQYEQHNCDGIFLPIVDSFGTRLPADQILDQIRSANHMSCSVLDAAQAIAHVPLNLNAAKADFVVAGCHKWIGAGNPLGLGFLCNPDSKDEISHELRRRIQRSPLTDPQLAFTENLIGGSCRKYGETVPVAPLFTANAAAVDCTTGRMNSHTELRGQIVDTATQFGWRPIQPTNPFRSRVLLLRAPQCLRGKSPDLVRQRLQDAGLIASTYRNGLVRVSIPHRNIDTEDLSQLSTAFRV